MTWKIVPQGQILTFIACPAGQAYINSTCLNLPLISDIHMTYMPTVEVLLTLVLLFKVCVQAQYLLFWSSVLDSCFNKLYD
jgi:hypothetical protein